MYPFLLDLHRAGRDSGLAALQLRYRVRGYNEGDPVADVEWALSEIARRHGDVPVCMVGHSMGARSVLRCAGHESVRAVVALAPWLPPGEPTVQLAGRTVVMAHGTRDRTTSPARSLAYALAAREICDRLCRFEVAGARHAAATPWCGARPAALELRPWDERCWASLSTRYAAAAERAARPRVRTTAAYVISRRHEVRCTSVTAFGTGRAAAPGPGHRLHRHNERTYPHLLRLFGELGVATQASDMSFGVRCEQCGLEYAGARGLAGVAARPSRLLRPEYLRMLAEVRRFHRHARQLLRDTTADRMTLAEFLERGRYSQYFHDHFLLPLTGAVWSCGPGRIREFPARYLVRFFANHGMLTVKHAPAWKTVTGGSGVYVRAVVGALHDTMSDTEVVAVERDASGVTVTDAGGRARRFDRVVIATHPDQALRLLADPTPSELRVLSSFDYASNETVLHTDGSLLPQAQRRPRLVELPARGLHDDHADGGRHLPPQPPAGA